MGSTGPSAASGIDKQFNRQNPLIVSKLDRGKRPLTVFMCFSASTVRPAAVQFLVGTKKSMTEVSTASEDEIRKFSAIADEWWDPAGSFRPLHQLNPVRVAAIRDRIAAHAGRDPKQDRPLSGLRIIDIGCGGGLISEALAAMGADVVGIDADPKAIAVAQIHAEKSGLSIDYRCMAPEALVGQEAPFDAVVSSEVVEHVSDVDAFVATCGSLCIPGGLLILTTLNRTLKSLAIAKIGAEYILRLLPAGTHDWRKFIRPSELAAYLRHHRFRLTDVIGMGMSPLEGRWKLTKDVSVNYIMTAVAPSEASA
jgi:2-polyprenyl-6-hydroxyphenyl methylase/3-demethylubiquinone-9 3-methyltransferase